MIQLYETKISQKIVKIEWFWALLVQRLHYFL